MHLFGDVYCPGKRGIIHFCWFCRNSKINHAAAYGQFYITANIRNIWAVPTNHSTQTWDTQALEAKQTPFSRADGERLVALKVVALYHMGTIQRLQLAYYRKVSNGDWSPTTSVQIRYSTMHSSHVKLHSRPKPSNRTHHCRLPYNNGTDIAHSATGPFRLGETPIWLMAFQTSLTKLTDQWKLQIPQGQKETIPTIKIPEPNIGRPLTDNLL